MRMDLERRLVEKFSDLFDRVREHPVYEEAYYGCDCGDGWFELIYSLCEMIAQRLRYLRADNKPRDFKITQIKEKFGGLRLYSQGGDEYIEGAIDLAEELSYKTCEVTGKPGALCRKPGGWLVVLCPEEAEKIGAKPHVWKDSSSTEAPA